MHLAWTQGPSDLGSWELDAGMRLQASQQLLKMLGLSGPHYDGRLDVLQSLLLPTDWEILEQAWAKLLVGEEVGALDLHLRGPNDGSLRVLRFFGDVLRDEDGKFLRWVGVCQDITEQRDAEERHRMLSGTVQEAVGRFTEDGVCVYMSSAGLRLFDCPRSNLIGAQLVDLLQSEYRSYVDLLFREIVSGQRPQASVDVRIRRPLWVELRLYPLKTRREVLIAWRDVEEEKKWEERFFQSQKMEAIGRLAGGVAHDFNNLLQVILGNLELICLGVKADSPERPLLLEVQQAGRRAAELTGKLLTFSRRDPALLRPVLINQALREIQSLVNRLIGEDILVSYALSENLPPIMADPLGLQQILLNLVVNARDAMPGGGELKVSTGLAITGPGGRPGNFVTLTVTDSGSGIDSEVRPYIFEPFFTTKEPGQGTGLGLATVYGLIRQWEGEVEVESQKSKGTTFRIFLPVSSDDVPLSRELPMTDPVAQSVVTILLVEDEDAVRRQISAQLKRQGHDVHEACDGRAALKLTVDCPVPDLLITDVVMPLCNGHELAVKLQELYPSLKVLYITGYAEEWLDRTGVPSDRLSILRKPFTIKELYTKIGEILKV